jgi:hypothetical protein
MSVCKALIQPGSGCEVNLTQRRGRQKPGEGRLSSQLTFCGAAVGPQVTVGLRASKAYGVDERKQILHCLGLMDCEGGRWDGVGRLLSLCSSILNASPC